MTLVDFAPAPRLALLVRLIAALPQGYLWLRGRGATAAQRLAMLTAVTLFLTFDLVVFGAFTRLSDSGLAAPIGPAAMARPARWALSATSGWPSGSLPPAP